jgi:hypothetical protein
MKTIDVYSENHAKPINTFCEQNAELMNINHVAHIVASVFTRAKISVILQNSAQHNATVAVPHTTHAHRLFLGA